jgi:hypothetical protein
METARAFPPWTTKCSPASITLAGALDSALTGAPWAGPILI